MSEQYTTLEESPGMMKAFANAGLEPDPVDAGEGNETQTGTDTQSGGTDTNKAGEDTISGGAGKDSIIGKDDGGKKSGEEKKGKDTSDPNDLKLTDGTVVKAGAERRHYEQGQIARQQLGLAKTELNTANQKLGSLQTKYDELSQTISKVGLEKPEDVSAAVVLYKDLNRDPVGTMTKLLAEMKALGHTFEGVGGAIDTSVIERLINERLPKSSQEQQGLTPEQINEQATKDVTDFVGKFPDAVTHEAHIAALIDRSVQNGKPISLQDAYFMLKERVVADGLDWSKDLGPQVEARKQSQEKKPVDQKPRVGGRGEIAANPVDPSKQVVPERELDADSIVLAAMQENGFQYKR